VLCACSNGEVSNPPADTDTNAGGAVSAPAVTFKPGGDGPVTSKVQSPIQISYRVIGQPVVGQPTAIDLQFSSTLGARPFNVAYRINDSTALRLPETQLARVAVSPSLEPDSRGFAAQQVTVVPLREGRLFLNVAAEIETDTGSFSSVTAVPVQVGAAPREPEENGTVTTDDSGELIRSLPGRTE
jgi:hypothetical protein